jgi:hypothetical protein
MDFEVGWLAKTGRAERQRRRSNQQAPFRVVRGRVIQWKPDDAIRGFRIEEV